MKLSYSILHKIVQQKLVIKKSSWKVGSGMAQSLIAEISRQSDIITFAYHCTFFQKRKLP